MSEEVYLPHGGEGGRGAEPHNLLRGVLAMTSQSPARPGLFQFPLPAPPGQHHAHGIANLRLRISAYTLLPILALLLTLGTHCLTTSHRHHSISNLLPVLLWVSRGTELGGGAENTARLRL